MVKAGKKYEGRRVRLRVEVEDLVERTAEILGYLNYTIRNFATLIGLNVIVDDIERYRHLTNEDYRLLLKTVEGKVEELRRRMRDA